MPERIALRPQRRVLLAAVLLVAAAPTLPGLRTPAHASPAWLTRLNAFRTQAGVHAAAIYKSDLEGETEIAGLVYAGVDPRMVGLDYDIRVGPDSGRSNVRFVLQRQGIEADDAIVDLILEKARTERRMLPNSEVCAMARAAAAPEARPRAELSREAPASS